MNDQISNTLIACRKNFGKSPRKFSLYRRWKNKMPMPQWVRDCNDKRFEEIFMNQSLLLQEGQIVWGRVIQANELLFSPGAQDHPAAIIYSLDKRLDRDPDILEVAASLLYQLKGENTDSPELQIFADKLTDEMVTDLKLPIPLELTEGLECFYTCIMVHRSHLPNRILSMGLFPLVVYPTKTDATMILPCHYWPSFFVDLWKSS